jgi:hypothetical protein
LEAFAFSYSTKLADMADAVAMQPCVAPYAPFESRTRMGQSLMFSASCIMQGPTYQEKERRAAK